MNNRSSMKGMSQILSLVVGAAILMMVAMLLMFSATDVIGGGVGDAQIDSCTNQIDSQCAIRSSFDVPSQCHNLDGGEVNSRAASGNVYTDDLADEQGNPESSQVGGNIASENHVFCQ